MCSKKTHELEISIDFFIIIFLERKIQFHATADAYKEITTTSVIYMEKLEWNLAIYTSD